MRMEHGVSREREENALVQCCCWYEWELVERVVVLGGSLFTTFHVSEDETNTLVCAYSTVHKNFS